MAENTYSRRISFPFKARLKQDTGTFAGLFLWSSAVNCFPILVHIWELGELLPGPTPGDTGSVDPKKSLALAFFPVLQTTSATSILTA